MPQLRRHTHQLWPVDTKGCDVTDKKKVIHSLADLQQIIPPELKVVDTDKVLGRNADDIDEVTRQIIKTPYIKVDETATEQMERKEAERRLKEIYEINAMARLLAYQHKLRNLGTASYKHAPRDCALWSLQHWDLFRAEAAQIYKTWALHI